MTCHKFASGIFCTSNSITTDVEGQEVEIDFHDYLGPSFTVYHPACDLRLYRVFGITEPTQIENPVDIPTESMWAAYDAWVETWPDTIPEEGS